MEYEARDYLVLAVDDSVNVPSTLRFSGITINYSKCSDNVKSLWNELQEELTKFDIVLYIDG